MHSLNAQCLTSEYGSLESSPRTVTATVVAIERIFMTEVRITAFPADILSSSRLLSVRGHNKPAVLSPTGLCAARTLVVFSLSKKSYQSVDKWLDPSAKVGSYHIMQINMCRLVGTGLCIHWNAVTHLYCLPQEMRKRLRYLNHIPLTTEFHVVELKIKPPVLSKETLKRFQRKLIFSMPRGCCSILLI